MPHLSSGSGGRDHANGLITHVSCLRAHPRDHRRRARAAAGLFLQWDPNPEAEVVGYRVYVGTSQGSTTHRSTSETPRYTLAPAGQLLFAVAVLRAHVGNRSPTSAPTRTGRRPRRPATRRPALGHVELVGRSDGPGYLLRRASGRAHFNQTASFLGHRRPWDLQRHGHRVGRFSALRVHVDHLRPLPGVATPLRPTGHCHQTPTFEWESRYGHVVPAVGRRLLHDGPQDPARSDPAQASCATRAPYAASVQVALTVAARHGPSARPTLRPGPVERRWTLRCQTRTHRP
jgi:hypothetical protein